jgi:predicted dinucleotide-binding enzyme
MNIAVIGAGNIGGTLTRHLTAVGTVSPSPTPEARTPSHRSRPRQAPW